MINSASRHPSITLSKISIYLSLAEAFHDPNDLETSVRIVIQYMLAGRFIYWLSICHS